MLKLVGWFLVVAAVSTAVWFGLSSLIGGNLDRAWWGLMLVIGVTGYVQDVGSHFARVSGLSKFENRETYYLLFRGIPWLLFRFGGLIRISCLVAILAVAGWKAAAASLVGLLVISLVLFPVSKNHAFTMYKQVMEQAE